MNQQVMHIGLDDTDSTRKGCTTYVTALLVEELEKLNVTFLDYPKLVGDHGLEVMHLSRFIRQQSPDSKLNAGLQKMDGTATYQDACRLSRHLGVYEDPRALIIATGLDLVEMEHMRHASLCCGTTGWTSCGKVSKNIQVQRLREAKATGADIMITSCVKCQIHLKCAQQDPDLRQDIAIKIQDLTTVLADRL